MIVEDFIMLGKTVPECSSDGRMFVCSAGFSLEMRQFIRIYPLARKQCPQRWSVSRVPLERNPKDSRDESWQIRGDRAGGAHERINQAIEPLGQRLSDKEKIKVVEKGVIGSIQEANACKQSLAIIQPLTVPELRFEVSDEAEMAPTPDLFPNWRNEPVKQRFAFHPRLRFRDEGGKHDLMLRDWGCYEFLRKQGDLRRLELEDALNLDAAPPLFVGNLNRFRNAWLIIGVLSGHLFTRPHLAEQHSLFVG